MRIEFDSKNAEELAGVAALIAVLRGENFATGRLLVTQELQPRELASGETLHSADDAPADPAHAFAGGASADQAFAEPAALPPTAEPAAGPTTPTPAAPATPAAPPAGGDTASPASTAPAPPAPPAGVTVDKNGLPHDGRIHSSPPKLNADGSWRQKRGVDPALVATVGAELRQIMAAGTPAAAPAAEPAAPAVAPAVPLPPTGAASAPAPDTPAPPATAATGLGSTDPAATASAGESAAPAPGSEVPAAPVPPAAPAAPAAEVPAAPAAEVPAAPAAEVPAAPAAATGLTFPDLMRKITGMQSAGHLTVEGTGEIAQSLGLTGVRDLMKRPDLIPAFDQLLPVTPAA